MDDCIIVGGGPAGLTAAIYLARFHLRVRVFDCGTSRAATIPCTHNHAGFPDGISGRDLLRRMRMQAQGYGAEYAEGRVQKIDRREDGTFAIRTERAGAFEADTILLATGVVNHRPAGMDDTLHDRALAEGLLRYCPICDGYEVTDRRVGVIGTSDHGMREAIFLRGYTADITLIAPDSDHHLDPACIERLDDAGIRRVDGPCGNYRIEDGRLVVATAKGDLAFDSVYPALGSRIRSRLATAMGADATDDGCLTVDDHQRTSIDGLFAAGDVVKGLDQISHAMGEASVAATTIRNYLADRRRLYR